jgi:N-glycosylase/DNA lyase
MTQERLKGKISASQLAKISTPEFDLARTIDSGQAFHWHPFGEGWLGTIGGTPVQVLQQKNMLLVTKGTEVLVREYFALGHPLGEIYETFPKDSDMQTALDFSRGISIMKQPVWECLATFITSSMKQVIHIRQMSLAIRKTFGRKVVHNGFDLFTYPTPECLAGVDELELRACKLGFRARNLIGAARMIAAGKVDLQCIGSMDDADALAELCKLPGVGEKVANCVLLFGYARLRAFPIDVWIERVLREIYFKGKRRVTTQRLKLFAQEYFGPYGGYAQQYLFHYARKTYRKRTGS